MWRSLDLPTWSYIGFHADYDFLQDPDAEVRRQRLLEEEDTLAGHSFGLVSAVYNYNRRSSIHWSWYNY